MSSTQLQTAIKTKKIKQGTFHASTENFREGFVSIHGEEQMVSMQKFYSKCSFSSKSVYFTMAPLVFVNDTGHYLLLSKPVFSLGLSQHTHKITNLWTFELSWSSELREINERKKHPCHTKLWTFRCLISGPQNLIQRSWSQIQILTWKITSFSKTMLLQREPFLTMFCTINISPLLVTK